MDNFNIKKGTYIEQIADYILKNGISKTSLKKMADAASTSDRMLMHYFKDKDEILALTLMHISHELIRLLDSNTELSLSFDELILYLSQAIKDTRIRPYLNLWLELALLASGETEPYCSVAKKIGDSYWEWLLKTYRPNLCEDQGKMVALIYAITEGFVFMDKIGAIDKIDMALKAILSLYRNNQDK